MADLTTVMAVLEKVNKDRGVSLGGGRGGKLYTMVQDRVLEWRRVFGCQHGVNTTILRDDSTVVQVQATITDEQGRVIGSGMAEEIRGASGVNKTSALENCETSAIGRALASLGLHGGEYASVQEVGKKGRYDHIAGVEAEMAAAKTAEAKTVKPEPTIDPPKEVADEIPFDDKDVRSDWAPWVEDHIAGMQKHRNVAEHRRWSSTIRPYREQLEKEDPVLHAKLLNAYEQRKQILENY